MEETKEGRQSVMDSLKEWLYTDEVKTCSHTGNSFTEGLLQYTN